MLETNNAVIADFIAKVDSNEASIGIVGLGYVGLPLAEAFVRGGLSVIGYDINESRAAMLNSGQSGMTHIDDSRVAVMLEKSMFRATTDAKDLTTADAILICVPTPLDIYQQPDLSYVESTCRRVKEILRPGQLIVLESTTFPGTTTDVMKPILEESGLKEGIDFALAYSPEREDPGNPNFETGNIPKVVGADSQMGREMATAVYDKIVKTVAVSSSRVAEATKLLENIYRWVNIALVNELKGIFEQMDIDVWEVIDAAKTKPFGFHAFYPGPGVGGHCIRVDPYYLTWQAKKFGLSTHFIQLAGEINTNMPKQIVHRLLEELSRRHNKALSGSKILLCGVAYKQDIDDMRESPSLELIHLLRAQGANVDYYDPYIPVIPETREHPELFGMESIQPSEQVFSQYDAALIATPHSNVDYRQICEHVPLIIDTRNTTAAFFNDYSEKIVKA